MITFGFFSPTELIVILIIVLVIFGPRKLPDIGRAFGEMITGFKKSTREEDDDTNSSNEKK